MGGRTSAGDQICRIDVYKVSRAAARSTQATAFRRVENMRLSRIKNKILAPFGRSAKKGLDGGDAFAGVSALLVRILDNASTTRHNRKLLSDTAGVTIKAAALRSSIHSARKRMKRGRSRRRIAAVLEGLNLKSVEDETNSILREDARRWFLGHTLDIAIDTHLIPYHGRHYKRKEELGRCKQKDGTTRFHVLATAYAVGERGKRFTLAVIFVPLGTSMRDSVRDLLYLLRRCRITVWIMLLDRGFYAIEVVRLLRRLDIGFIIPMKGNRLKKKKGSYRTAYCMKSTNNGKPVSLLVNAASVIKYNKGKRFGHHGAMQLCFITGGIDFALRRIAELYRKRFGIESSYKLDKSIRPRTSSRNPAIRLFLFNAAVLIQNLWVWIKLYFCRHADRTSRLMVTLRDFADILLRWIRVRYGEDTSIG